MTVDEVVAEVAAETAAETTEEILETAEENAEATEEIIDETNENLETGTSPIVEVSAALDMDARIRQIVRDECGVIVSAAIEGHGLSMPHGETVVVENVVQESPMETTETQEETEDEPPDLGHRWYRNFR
jgi:hypothetical protein